MATLDDLKADAKQYGVDLLVKRFQTLKNRSFVIFPWLRIRLLLRRISKL